MVKLAGSAGRHHADGGPAADRMSHHAGADHGDVDGAVRPGQREHGEAVIARHKVGERGEIGAAPGGPRPGPEDGHGRGAATRSRMTWRMPSIRKLARSIGLNIDRTSG
jgi:hypothetical protein